MTRRMIGLAVVSLFFVGTTGQAQETYTIKLKEPEKGDSYLWKTNENGKTTTKITDGAGNALKEENEVSGKNIAYIATILEKAPGEKRSTSFSRAYEKASITKKGEARTSGLEGKKVVIEKKGDKYQYRFDDGKELTAEQIDDLDFKADKESDATEQDMMPKQPVKINETWAIDPKLFTKNDKEAEQMIDVTKAKGTGKLLRVYQKDGKQFGVIELQFDLPFKDLPGVKVQQANLIVKGTIDACIDGSSIARSTNVAITIDMRGMIDAGDQQYNMVVSGSGTTMESMEEVKKK